jgi:hypothetical protein
MKNKKEIKAECNRRYREKNKEKIAERKREYYQKNKERINKNPKTKENKKRFYDINKNKINEKRRQNRLANVEEARRKERERKRKYKQNLENRKKWLETTKKYVKNKLEKDPVYKLKLYYRNSICKAKIKNDFKKKSRTAEYLGCDWETFKKHIENQFEPWMNWSNWGQHNPNSSRTWNIDHIKPLAKFDFSKREEIEKAFNYKNCRPYCSRKNLVEQHYR